MAAWQFPDWSQLRLPALLRLSFARTEVSSSRRIAMPPSRRPLRLDIELGAMQRRLCVAPVMHRIAQRLHFIERDLGGPRLPGDQPSKVLVLKVALSALHLVGGEAQGKLAHGHTGSGNTSLSVSTCNLCSFRPSRCAFHARQKVPIRRSSLMPPLSFRSPTSRLRSVSTG